MRRREFIASLGAVAAWPIAARAQQTGKPLRVGTVAAIPRRAVGWPAFEKRMAELGYIEGQNFIFDYVNTPAYEAGFRELMERKPDIIATGGSELLLERAMAAAGATPIVLDRPGDDPIALNVVRAQEHDLPRRLDRQRQLAAIQVQPFRLLDRGGVRAFSPSMINRAALPIAAPRAIPEPLDHDDAAIPIPRVCRKPHWRWPLF
jgi:hypothetical protein